MTRALLLSAIVLGVTSAIPMLAAAQCGNGTIDGAEACDDGNTDAGDGCASACTVEAGFACARQTAVPLINASFDLPITAGSTGWVLAAGTIDQISNACLPADDGTLAVDMNGSSRGEIHQDIPTVVGRTYVMTLRGSANCVESAGDPCNSTCVKRLTISAADTAIPTAPYQVTTYDLRGNPSTASGAWRDVAFQFTAVSTMTRIRFSGSDPSFAGPMVDRAAIPESVCRPNTCGNGTREALEACDDGNTMSGDGCSSDCFVQEVGWMCTPGTACTPICGDGVKVEAEACDDGNAVAGDGCAACVIEPGWTCIVDPLSIRSQCRMTCGDGTIDPGEMCDDGNFVAGDGCSPICAQETGFTCITQEAIPLINASFETPITTVSAGWVLATGNIDQIGFGCLPADDGAVGVDMNGTTRGEIYQDVTTVAGRTYFMTMRGSANCIEVSGQPCDRACTKILTISAADPAVPDAPFTVTTYELAGGPLAASGGWRDIIFRWTATGTRTRIRLSGSDPSAAGPFVDRAEIPPSVCRPDTCGNSVLNAGETCDDGNQLGGDGCEADCSTEHGWSCPTAGVPCVPAMCGDGIKVSAEACDDGNTTADDGCSPTCTVEPDWTCIVDPLLVISVCTTDCGNGTVEAGEGCDDGNRTGGDGCGPSCTVEMCGNGVLDSGEDCDPPGETSTCDTDCTPARCGDGAQNMTAGESCDDGNTTAGDGCSATCVSEMCGNSIVDAGEGCDTGGASATCDADCTPAMCGDGALNGAAGEACDDGNTASGDGCSGTCMVETPVDAGRMDAGLSDAGADAGAMDAGRVPGGASGGACICAAHARRAPGALACLAALGWLGLAYRRRARRG